MENELYQVQIITSIGKAKELIMDHLHVMYASDENYAPFLGVSLYSLLENNRDIKKITIYAVLDNVSSGNKDRLSKMVNTYSRELVIVDAKEFNKAMQELGVPKYRGSYTTHFRKFFHLFMGEDVKRFLYIDSDFNLLAIVIHKNSLNSFTNKCTNQTFQFTNT